MHDPPFWHGFGIQASPTIEKQTSSKTWFKFCISRRMLQTKHSHIWQVSPWNPERHWHVKPSRPCVWQAPPFKQGLGMQISPTCADKKRKEHSSKHMQIERTNKTQMLDKCKNHTDRFLRRWQYGVLHTQLACLWLLTTHLCVVEHGFLAQGLAEMKTNDFDSRNVS